MLRYQAPERDIRFVLFELLRLDRPSANGAAALDREVAGSVLSQAAKLAQRVIVPLSGECDQAGNEHVDGEVRVPDALKTIYSAYVEAGWSGFGAGEEHGGQGLPRALWSCVLEIFNAGNMAFGMFPSLNAGAQVLLNRFGSADQKKRFLPELASGRSSATMAMTEHHSGTDLGLMRTVATRGDDAVYRLSGTKIFISGGDHDLTENILHFVLARTEGAPPGLRGLSLFIVPKFLDDGHARHRRKNALSCGGIEHKLGIKANPTCTMNFDGSIAYLLGEAGQGLQQMFTMMNEIRLDVGIQGIATAEIAYQNAVAYAKERLQGRSVLGRLSDAAADPILMHPDVRRMLLDIRVQCEAGRAMALEVAHEMDLARGSGVAESAALHADRVALLTPVLKSYFSDFGFEAASTGLQCFGGHGFVREQGMEQLLRDARIGPIYEGANGIQALDLVMRKLNLSDGSVVGAYLDEIESHLTSSSASSAMRASESIVNCLAETSRLVRDSVNWARSEARRSPHRVPGGASALLRLFALLHMAYVWARAASVASDAMSSDAGDRAFYRSKLMLADYYAHRFEPEAVALAGRLRGDGDAVMRMQMSDF
jgi:alkylation response protein AidB-like acyl-CoA dehydrogenase